MLTGTAAEVADALEQSFEATGASGGFMIGQCIAVMADLHAIVES